MKKTILTSVSALIVGAFLVACSPKSPKMVPLPNYEKATKLESLGEMQPPPVDILFAIDNSGSMGTHQTNLSSNIDKFINGIGSTQLDYHIAVITSDDAEFFGNPTVVTNSTHNGMDLLKKNLKPGSNGSSNEIFFDFISEALSKPLLKGINSGFLRDDALLAIIIVTDTDDHGSLEPDDLYKQLVVLKSNDPKMLATYGVTTDQINNNNNCPNEHEPNPNGGLPEFFKISGGTVIDLCDRSYGQKLADIGSDIKSKAPQYVRLKQIPVVNTIRVMYGSQIVPNDAKTGWVYDPKNNRLVFGRELTLLEEPPGTQIEVFFIPADLE